MTEPVQQAEDHQNATIREYGTYIATSPIDIGGARAFNVGDPVPTSTVERSDSPIDKTSVEKRTKKKD